MTTKTRAWFGAVLSLVLAGACAAPSDADTSTEAVASSEQALLDGIDPLPRELLVALLRYDHLTEEERDRVYELHHFLRVGPDRRVHVVETFTVRSFMRWPYRGVLMLPGTLSLASFYNLDVEGYRFQDTLAREGYFAFAIDYEGSGSSTYPANGYDVTHDYLVESSRRVLQQLRLLRLVPRMDVFGESNGGSIAAELCDDRRSARSCVMASMLYDEGTDFFNAVFLDPAFIGFLMNQPEGYLQAGPEMYFNIAARMSPEVAAEALATQPGRFAAGPTVAPVDGLPWFDPTRAQVPGLIIQGTEDNVATQADNDTLAAVYGSAPNGGGVATVVRIEGAGMIPRVEPAPVNEIFTDIVLDFLATH